MSKSRTITGFGPSNMFMLSSTGVTYTGPWLRFGPFVGNQLSGQMVWSTAGSSAGQSLKIQGTLTTGSTADIVDLVTFLSTAATDTQISASSTKRFASIRLLSTAKKVSVAQQAYFLAVV